MPSTKAKRMLVHTYRDDVYITTEEFPSVIDTVRVLRTRGWSFQNARMNRIGDESITLQNGNLFVEIEEAVDEEDEISLGGVVYIPVKRWASLHGMSVRQAKYAYFHGRIEGVAVGNRNYLYIRKDRNGKS